VVLMAHGWFMLIVLASYTANLANFLTSANMAPTLGSWAEVQDSFGQYKLALQRGSAHESYINVQQELYAHEYNITWTESWEDAMALVEDGVVDATFHDEPMAQRYINEVANAKECLLAETGKIFNSFGYGFAFPFDNPDFIAFSQAIVYLKENGKLRSIIKRYSVGTEGKPKIIDGEPCSLESKGGVEDDSFHLYDMGGLLWMTAILITLAFAINCYERVSHNLAIIPCLQPCQDLCCPQPKDIADDDSTGYGGGRDPGKWDRDDDDETPLPSSALTLALSEGVRAGILEAIQKIGTDPRFTSGMSGIELMENAGFVDTPRGLLGEGLAAAEKVPGVGLLMGGLSSVGNLAGGMVGIPAGGAPEGTMSSPRRPYSQQKRVSPAGAVSVDTSDTASRTGAFPAPSESKTPKAPRGLDMEGVEEEDEEANTDETTVRASNGYSV
jgi:hypothetical protein